MRYLSTILLLLALSFSQIQHGGTPKFINHNQSNVNFLSTEIEPDSILELDL